MKRTFLLLTALALLSSALFAAGKCYWQANGVLVTGIDGMGIGDLVTDMRGGAYIVTSDLYKVYLIRIDKNGNLPWGLSGKTVDTTTMGAFQMNTYGVSDSCGGVIIVWDKFFPTGHVLYAQRVDSSGNNMWSGIGRLVTLSDSSQEKHVVVSDNHKGVIVAWQESWNGQYDIYVQRLDSIGARKWGGNGKVVCNASGDQQMPKIKSAGNNGCVIGWVDGRSDLSDVYVQIFDSIGNSRWNNNGEPICALDSVQSIQGLACDKNGDVYVSWNDKRNGDWNIFAQRCDSMGNKLWDSSGVSVCTADSTQSGGEMIKSGNNAILIWADNRNGNFDIYGQSLASSSASQWITNGQSICVADSLQGYQHIITDSHSGALICWQDKRSGNNDIYAQHVDSAGNVKWAVNGMAVCTAAGTQERPQMVASDSGTAIIAWPDGRSGQWRAYAQRVGDDPNGVAGEPVQSLPLTVASLKCHPNPFNQSTTISYQLSTDNQVKLIVYNISGQLVKTLVNSYMPAGMHACRWDGVNDKGIKVGCGVYFYSLSLNDRSSTKKMILIK